MEQPKKTMLDQLAIFYYRKWLFIIPVLLGAAAGLLISIKLPETYSSTTLILAEEQQLPEQYVTPTDKTPFAQRLETISQQIMSRSRLEGIIKKYELYHDETPGILSSVYGLIRLLMPSASFSTAESVERMRRDIEFMATSDDKRPRLGGETFTITYTGRDPKLTMKVTNTIAALFIEENLKTTEQFAAGTSDFLSNELSTAKGELDGFEKQVKEFKETHMGSLPEQLDANLRTLDRLQSELLTVSAAIRNNEDRKTVLEEQMRITPDGAALPAAGPLAAELERLKGELSTLLSIYRENYPDVVMTKNQIKRLEEQISAGPAPSPGKARAVQPDRRNMPVYSELMATKSQITTLKQRETELKRQIKDYESRVENAPANEQKQADLMRDYRISLQNYQALLEKKMNAKLAENLVKRQRDQKFRVIDPANYPQKPIGPDKVKISLLGTMAGGALGTALVFLFEVLTPPFRKPEDFDGILPVPVLASIPVFPAKAKKKTADFKVIKGRK